MEIKWKKIYIFFVIWQFFMFDNGRLRVYPYLFWPLMTGIALVCMLSKRRVKVSLLGTLTLLAGITAALSSLMSQASSMGLMFLLELVMYFICVQFISGQDEGVEFALRTAYGFAIYHLVFLLMQCYIPALFNPLAMLLKGSSETFVISNMALSQSYRVYLGMTGQTSTISLYLIFGLILALNNIQKTGYKRHYVLTCVFLIGLFLTNRRANSLCGVALVVLYFALENRQMLYKMLVAVLAVAAVLIIGVQNIPGLSGILSKFQLAQVYGNMLSGREDTWGVAIKLFQENPWFGVGFNTYTLHATFYNAHNSYLQKLCELGVIGVTIYFAPFILSLGQVVKCFFYSRRKQLRKTKIYQDTLLAIMFFAYVVVIAFSEGMFETEIFYVMLFLFQSFTRKISLQLRNRHDLPEPD